jgi:hypothetical protein
LSDEEKAAMNVLITQLIRDPLNISNEIVYALKGNLDAVIHNWQDRKDIQ